MIQSKAEKQDKLSQKTKNVSFYQVPSSKNIHGHAAPVAMPSLFLCGFQAAFSCFINIQVTK
jgi:hypothetical protein